MQPNAVVEVKAPAGRAVRFGANLRLALIAGPCQLESRAHALETAQCLKEIAERLDVAQEHRSLDVGEAN